MCDLKVMFRIMGVLEVGRIGHGPHKILVGWATMPMAPPKIGLHVIL